MAQAIPPRRILIVDGSSEDRAVVRRLLAADNTIAYEITEAATGEEGLEFLRISRFDCLLLDHSPPDCDGLEFLDRLSRLSANDTMIPVVILTGRVDEVLIVEVLKRGGQDSLIKGRFTSEVLRRSINDSVVRVEIRRELDRLHRQTVAAIRRKDEAIARQSATEARLRHQLDLIETVARTATEGLCMVDCLGRLTFVNPAAASILGGAGPSLLGAPLPILQTETNRSLKPPSLVSGGWEDPGQIVRDRAGILSRADGTTIPVAFSSTPILADGELVGIVVAIRDVTDQRRIEAEMERRAAELVEAGRRKDEFLAMLAHELRNPLAPILNAMRIIGLRGGADPAEERTRAMVEQQVRHMNRLIDDLLDMSRISRGTIQLRTEPTRLGDAVDRAVAAIRHQIDARGQTLTVSVPDEPIWLVADPTRLDQILNNLLTNAAKYTDPNGRIDLAVARDLGNVEVRINDSGVGIAADFLPKIFDLFAQADRSLDRSQGGLGIGLTLVRDLVERHGGSISARSEGLGLGSEFIVRLPSLVESAPPADRGAKTEAPTATRSVRVLVIDDNVHAAQSLAVVLQLWGHDVRIAHDGPSALDAAPDYRPEVVLLDIGLPKMDGYRVAEQIRTIPILERTAILAMTGYAAEEDRRRSAAAGFVRHLVKPLDLDALERYLAEFGPPTDARGGSLEATAATDELN